MSGERARYRRALQDRAISTRAVDALVDAIASAAEGPALAALFACLSAEADRVPWHWDCDYAALALKEQARQAVSAERRRAMLDFALGRAGWCAGCATSGSEGLARSRHVRELKWVKRLVEPPP